MKERKGGRDNGREDGERKEQEKRDEEEDREEMVVIWMSWKQSRRAGEKGKF